MSGRAIALFVSLGLTLAAPAQFMVGRESLLEDPLDFKSAMELAQKGEARGFYQLAIKFSAGEGVARNRAAGYRFLEKAADMGYANALYVLGRVKAADFSEMGALLFLDERTTAVPQTASLTGAILWDGERRHLSITNDAAYAVVSNCFARAAAGGIGAAEDDLKVLQEKRTAVLEAAAAHAAAQGDAEANLAAARTAFPDLAVAEYPLPPFEPTADPRPLSLRDPNAYLDAQQRHRRHTDQLRKNPSSVELWRLRENRRKAEQAKQYANLRIDSVCGISFGAPPPEWLKMRGRSSSSSQSGMAEFASGKLPKPFRYFTDCNVELTSTGLVKTVSLRGNLHPSMSAEDQKKEYEAVVAALEKRYAFKFPPLDEMGGVRTSWFGDIGRYHVNLSIGTTDKVPCIWLGITDTDMVKQEMISTGIRRELPRNAGEDAL